MQEALKKSRASDNTQNNCTKKPIKFDQRCFAKKTALPTTTKPSIEVKGSRSNEQKVTLVLKRVEETREKKSGMENLVVEVEQHENDSYV